MPAQRLSKQNKKVLVVCPGCAQQKLAAANDFKKHIVLCSRCGAGMREKKSSKQRSLRKRALMLPLEKGASSLNLNHQPIGIIFIDTSFVVGMPSHIIAMSFTLVPVLPVKIREFSFLSAW
jgi:Zn ribbon nucleic-acid-binding protein